MYKNIQFNNFDEMGPEEIYPALFADNGKRYLGDLI